MNKVYIGYQGELPVRVESSREAIENDLFLKCDRIVEHEGRAELVGGKVLFDTDIDVARGAETIAEAKATRAALVEKATVEVDGMTFDADETSQNRLSRGITAALALGLGPDETTEWTLADNSSAQVTVQQMARALLAAGQYQTSVWRMPYNQVEEVKEKVKEEQQTEVLTGSTGYSVS